MKEKRKEARLFPTSELELALQEFLDAKKVLNDARKKAGEKKRKYLALGGTLVQEDFGPRNALIYQQHKAGKTVNNLSGIFRLSEDRIRTIIGREKFREIKRKQ